MGFYILSISLLVIGIKANAAQLSLYFTEEPTKGVIVGQIVSAQYSAYVTKGLYVTAERNINGKSERFACNIPGSVLDKDGLDAIGLLNLALNPDNRIRLGCIGKTNDSMKEIFHFLKMDAESAGIMINERVQ